MALQNDPFASFAPVTQQVSRPVQPTKPVPETPTRAPKSQRSLIDGLELDVTGSEIRDDANENAVVDLLSRHDGILVQSKRTSKIWDRTFLVLRQLLDGSILDVNQVDSRWYASVSKRYPLVVPKYRDFNQMLVHLESAVQYIEEMMGGGYWYPKYHNGKRDRVTLADFIWTLTRTGAGWSPYLQIIATDLITPKMLKESLPARIVPIGQTILERSWFYPTMTRQQEVIFWRHLKMLSEWFREHQDALYAVSTESKLIFGSFIGFLRVITEANQAIQCVGPSFIGPWTPKWETLFRWLESDRHCKIPRSLVCQ